MAQVPAQPGGAARLAAAVAKATASLGNRITSTRLPANCSVARLALFVALVASIVLASLSFDAQKIEGLLMWVQENKREGAVLFLALYTVGVVLMLPAMVMAMAAGAVFGLLYGTLLVWVGSSLGQTIAFVIGRYLLRELVVSYLTRQFPKWTAIDRALETEGWKLVTLLRLSPIAPWNVLNYALSVTAVPLVPYFLASALAILPYLLLFVYFGSLARNLADVFTGKTGFGTNTTIAVATLSGVLMVVIVWYTTHVSRKAISSALVTGDDGDAVAEIAADPDVAELLRVNSGEMAAAVAEHGVTPRSSMRSAGLELTAVAVGGGGSGGKHAASGGAAAGGLSDLLSLHAKKFTPAVAPEAVQLLGDRVASEAGDGVTGGGASAGPSRAHQRSSYAGGGTPTAISPLGTTAATGRGRLFSFA